MAIAFVRQSEMDPTRKGNLITTRHSSVSQCKQIREQLLADKGFVSERFEAIPIAYTTAFQVITWANDPLPHRFRIGKVPTIENDV